MMSEWAIETQNMGHRFGSNWAAQGLDVQASEYYAGTNTPTPNLQVGLK